MTEGFPDGEDMRWTATLRCTECGEIGTLHTTDPNQDHLWFDCVECEDCTEHELVMASDTSQSAEESR